MVEVIERGEPAIMVCHWPGIYFNGQEVGLKIFQEAVRRLHARYDNLLWMKLSEIARYWAAKELTRIERQDNRITLHAPFATSRFTLSVVGAAAGASKLTAAGKAQTLVEVSRALDLKPGSWTRSGAETLVCFDLPKGRCELEF